MALALNGRDFPTNDGTLTARAVAESYGEQIKTLEKKKAGDSLNANLIRKTLRDLTNESYETGEDWEKFWASNSGDGPKPAAPEGGGNGKADATKRRKRPISSLPALATTTICAKWSWARKGRSRA